MNLYKIPFLLIIIFLSFQAIYCQDAIWEEHSADEDLIILQETNIIDIVDHRVEFMMFYITRNVSFKIQSQGGIEEASQFILPEQLDPTYIFHAPKERNYSHVYSRMKCDYFKGSIRSIDGTVEEFDLNPEIQIIKMMMKDVEYFGDYKKFIYSLKDLKVGDIVNIEYKYSVPYVDNFYQLSCFRVFFNSDVPKKNYQLKLSHHPELFFQTEFMNSAEPDTVSKTEEKTSYEWSRENLLGCINEPGGRPYLNLPHITFSPMSYDLYYTVAKSFEPRFTPFYVLYAQMREERHPAITLSVIQGVNTPDYLLIRRFVERISQGLDADTLGIEKIKKIHETITDDFKYKDNMEYFTRDDIRDPKPGDQIRSEALRDLSRNDLYLALMLELDLNYCTTYLSDNRSGVISDNFFTPMFDSDMLYTAFFNTDQICFFYPKRARFGYYMNELPFYYENTRARLVHISDYIKKDMPIEEHFQQVFTPRSPVNVNIRNTKTAVEIKVDELETTFKTQVYLSGQFSTMTRGLYQYDHKQEKVNELYNKKVWEISDDIKLASENFSLETKQAPFTARINAQYSSENILTRNQDILNLSIKNWFNHIIYPQLTAKNRQMPFYPDFSHRDSYIYFIQTDQNIELIEKYEALEISTEHLSFNLSIDQLSDNSFKIESFLALTGIVSLEEMQELEQAFSKIAELNNGSIQFKIKP